jgi:phosphate starvation-inducible PhoH-like protein
VEGAGVVADETVSTTIEVDSHEEAMALFGPGDRNLRLLRDGFYVQLIGRGCTLKLSGGKRAVDQVTSLVSQFISLRRSGAKLPDDYIEREIERRRRLSPSPVVGPTEPRSAATGVGRLTSQQVELARGLSRSPGQERYLRAILENDLVCCVGPAGTGKTFLAVRMAIDLLREDLVRKIILCRPAVEAGEKLGFLPGDFQAKINPYLRPLYDALNDILDYDQVKRYLEREIIEILPLAYMRGRTLNNAFIILDEGQNTTVSQMKMFLTRMGMNSRIVVNGDVTQVDLPEGQLSGLIHAQRIIRGIPGIGWAQLEKADIVRHPLVRRIVEAYEASEANPSQGD